MEESRLLRLFESTSYEGEGAEVSDGGVQAVKIV